MGSGQSKTKKRPSDETSATAAMADNSVGIDHKNVNGYTNMAKKKLSERSSVDSEDEDVLCSFPFLGFLFCPPNKRFARSKKINKGAAGAARTGSDPIGTPVPDTPVDSRRKRREMLEAAGQADADADRVVFMSRYGGLEKECSGDEYGSSSFGKNGGKAKTLDHAKSSKTRGGIMEVLNEDYHALHEQQAPAAGIYEGKHAERELYAKYEVCEVLGVGSTSTCNRCVSRSTGQSYACKIIDKRHIAERFHGMIEQFHREIDALRSLQHPNIIRLFDVFITDDKIYIVMELMEGGELFDYVVQKGTLNEEEASRIVRQITSALVYMHSKNIIHRDLKPENLLLTHKPRTSHDIEVKIIDFGLSKTLEEPVARSFLGTRGYLAPEMLQRKDYSRAVDAWSLGVIVFVLVCGCLPFDDDSQTVPSDDLVRTKFVLRFPRWAKNLSAPAKDLLSHLLDVNPRTRFTAEQALYHPWVTGKAAPKDSLLQSPRMMQKSPRARKAGRVATAATPSPSPPTPTNAGAAAGRIENVVPAHAHRGASRRDGNLPPRVTRQLVRKTSI